MELSTTMFTWSLCTCTTMSSACFLEYWPNFLVRAVCVLVINDRNPSKKTHPLLPPL